MRDSIEKSVQLNAPIERVWRALSDYKEFGAWFKVNLEGPFVLGEVSLGQITYPGYEHLKWQAWVEVMEPPRLFVLTWVPHVMDPEADITNEPRTRVEFKLTPSEDGGTLLELSETGFSALPEDVRASSMLGNEQGWTEQMENIKNYVEALLR